jgi:hypothetical protein
VIIDFVGDWTGADRGPIDGSWGAVGTSMVGEGARGALEIGVVGDLGDFAGVSVVGVDWGEFGDQGCGLGMVMDSGAFEGDVVFRAGDIDKSCGDVCGPLVPGSLQQNPTPNLFRSSSQFWTSPFLASSYIFLHVRSLPRGCPTGVKPLRRGSRTCDT